MKKRLILVFIIIIYSLLLIKVMVFKDIPVIRIGHLMFNFGGVESKNLSNFVPFKTILFYLLGNNGFVIALINLVGNVVLLVPIGFLFSFIYSKTTWQKIIVLAVVVGLSIEVMQAVLGVGVFDIDDLILNGFGVVIGYWVSKLFAKGAK